MRKLNKRNYGRYMMTVDNAEAVFATAQELTDAPLVYGWAATKCENPSCPAVHVYLLGEMDKVIAQIAIDEAGAMRLTMDIHLAMTGQRSVQ
jgi:hypothetical protein